MSGTSHSEMKSRNVSLSPGPPRRPPAQSFVRARPFPCEKEAKNRPPRPGPAPKNGEVFCARPLGYRLRVFAYKLGLLERRFKQGHEILCVLAFRESGKDAAEPSVDLGLREKCVAES